jgi:hypothetical protein
MRNEYASVPFLAPIARRPVPVTRDALGRTRLPVSQTFDPAAPGTVQSCWTGTADPRTKGNGPQRSRTATGSAGTVPVSRELPFGAALIIVGLLGFGVGILWRPGRRER